jgi:D-alanyl-D-alanine carboxypeptidase
MGRGLLVVTFAFLAAVLAGHAAAAAPPFASSVRAATVAELGASYHPGCPVGPSELRAIRLAYWGFDGQRHLGTIVVNSTVVPAVRRIFRRLYAHRFPIRSMEPVAAFGGNDNRSMAADNTSAFNCRYAVATGPKRWSVHAYGEAIDVDPLENPYLLGATVYPPAGRPFLDRSDARAGMAEPDGALVAAFAASGWQWGGRWTGSPDYQHFSSNGG